ncbi:MAG: hypothetical protein H7039_06185 [Bryobacteraceae bacterium]|nr:hypothetical protein [Bryobacteraceae bacterium]
MTEVRQLRMALEQSAITLPRIQILLQRTQVQQGRVERLSSRLQELRLRTSGTNSVSARFSAEVREAEVQLSLEQDPIRRRDLQHRIDELKRQSQEATARAQQEQAQESETAGELNSERAKLDDLERQLTRLESLIPNAVGSSTPCPTR